MKLDESWFNNFEFIKDLSNEKFKEFLKDLKYPEYPDAPYASDLREIVDAEVDEIAADNTKSNYEKLSEYLKWYANDYPAQEKEIIQKYEKIKEWQDAYQKTLDDNNISGLWKLIDMDDSGVPYMLADDGGLYHYEDGEVKKIEVLSYGDEFKYSKKNNIIKIGYSVGHGAEGAYYDTKNNFKKLISYKWEYYQEKDWHYINDEEVSQDKYESSVKQYSSMMTGSDTISVSMRDDRPYTSVSAAYNDYQNNK